MLTGIALENVKAIKEEGSIDLTPFTLLIGENGSGKSTFIQILSLLSENSNSPSLEDGKYTILGGIKEIENDSEYSIDVKIKGITDWSLFTNLDYLAQVNYELMIGFGGDEIIEMGLKLDVRNPSEEMKTALNMTTNTILDSKFFVFEENEEQDFQLYDNKTKTILGPLPIKLEEPFKFTFDATGLNIDNIRPLVIIINSIFNKIKSDLSEIVHIPALRGMDARDYVMLENPADAPIDPTDFNKQAQKLVTSMEFDPDVVPKVSTLLESIINRKCRTKLLPGMKISLEIFNGKKWINIMSEGLGSNPLIHLIYQVVSAPRGSVVMIEEPEIHLFPSAQKKLIYSLIKFAKSNNLRLLFTTHSEHVYYVLAKYKEQHPDDVKIYFLNRDLGSNDSTVTEVTESNKLGILKEFLSIDLDDIAELFDVSGRS